MSSPTFVLYLVTWVILSAARLSAQTEVAESPIEDTVPLHSTTILARVDGNDVPVIGAAGQKAKVLVDGKVEKLKRDSAYTFARSREFAPGSILIARNDAIEVLTIHKTLDGVSIGRSDVNDEYATELLPDRDYADCFIAILFFNAGFYLGKNDQPVATVIFKHLGNLRAGIKKDVVVDLRHGPDIFRQHGVLPVVFSEGREIPSNFSKYTSVLFRRYEIAKHKKILANFLVKNPKADRAVVPYVQVIPPIPSGLGAATAVTKSAASALLTVNADGVVEHAKLTSPIPGDDHEQAILRALRGWLFLPQLREGVPVSAEIVLPTEALAGMLKN